MARKTHDAVYVEKYTDREGNEKKRYQNIGGAFTRDDGSMSIKLDSIPVGFNGWVSLYEPKEKAAPKKQQADNDDSDLPF